jgi:predicted dehydrogenase
MASPYNVALVGAGGIAAAHRSAAADTEGRVRVIAAVETNAEAPAANDLPLYGTVAALLESDDRPDAVIVCTPPSVRGDVIEPAVEAGLAVLCEKPLSRSTAEADALVDLADRHDAAERCFVGYCHRFAPAVVEMRRRLEAGDLGTLIRFENTFACWHPTMRDRWMSDIPISGGGSFLDTGCHSLDLFRFLVDEATGPETIRGGVFHREWQGRGESNATILLRSSQGAAGIINSGWQEADRFHVTLVGTKGSLSYDYMQPETLVWHASESPDTSEISIETHDVRFTRQLDAFARRASGATQPGDERLCTFAEAREVARLVDAAVAKSG